MNRKAAFFIAAMMAVCVLSAFAGEDADSVEGKVAECLKTVKSKEALVLGPTGKKAAMDFLAANAEKSAGPILDELGDAKDVGTRLWLLLTVNNFKDASVFNSGAPKILALLDDEHFGVKYWAIKTVAKMKLSDAVKPLTAMLESKVVVLRREAAVALGHINDTAVVGAVAKLLKDADESVRAAAAEALGLLKAAGAKGQLIEALKDEKLVVQQSAVAALEAITGKSFNLHRADWIGAPEERQKKINDWVKQNS
ncbi:MAG TPA: HEAT repeat domain-containing protein [Planctomycetota bacterium]|nr:HEAT repeat domain-containing protein [Planctomycetota bacterium]